MKYSLLWILVLLLSFTEAYPQHYELRAVNKGNGIIGVEMRITSGTPPASTNSVTDLVFGIKWLSSYNVDLESAITTSYNIVKSDTRKLKGSYHVQAFSATNTPFSIPANWALNSWVEIMSVRNTVTGTGTGTFEIAEPGFDNTTDPNLGIDLTDYTPVVTASAMNVALPVHLTKFELASGYRSIKLLWAANNEQNSKGFTVERSEEKGAGYKEIAFINSKGANSDNQYEFVDPNVQAGIAYYYRLKQIDLNGQYTYSETRSLVLDTKENSGIKIMPNPVGQTMQVLFDKVDLTGAATIKVFDVKGSLIRSMQYTGGRGGKMDIDVSTLRSGQHILTVEQAGRMVYSASFSKR
ncbi:MAG: T9SS type A sorting domain-containing protein [Williamsia sp.]|nr:T9SS type A sorting domain-containing protein [Williamsia sp.]